MAPYDVFGPTEEFVMAPIDIAALGALGILIALVALIGHISPPMVDPNTGEEP